MTKDRIFLFPKGLVTFIALSLILCDLLVPAQGLVLQLINFQDHDVNFLR